MRLPSRYRRIGPVSMRRNGRSAGHSVTLSANDPAHAEAKAKAKETGARAALRTVEATKGAEVSTSFVIPALVTGSAAQSLPSRARPSIASKAFLFACVRCQRTRSRSAIQPHDIAGNVRPKLRIDGAFVDKVDAVTEVPTQFIAQPAT